MTAVIASFDGFHAHVVCLEVGVVSDRDQGWHVEGVAQRFSTALNERLAPPSP